jgi:hypothetical protein
VEQEVGGSQTETRAGESARRDEGTRLRQSCAWIIEDNKSTALAGAIRFNSFEREMAVRRDPL